MTEENKTNILESYPSDGQRGAVHITSDLSALYEIIRSHTDASFRKNAAVQLLKQIAEDQPVDDEEIKRLYDAEKDIGVAAELKRALNKLKIRKVLPEDPTARYDRQLTPDQAKAILDEIGRLRGLYDAISGEAGSFEQRFTLGPLIAVGGMGRILKAVRRADNQPVAVKYLLLEDLAEHSDPQKIIARFRREGEILQRLDHPLIVKGYEYGEHRGEHFIVMEYVGGSTLDDMIKQGPLDMATFKDIALQLCDAVAYIHANGVIHRDIKPGNILVDGDGESKRIKLLDFGLSKDKTDGKLSRLSFRAGTDEYASPQQLHDARFADERDDIYSMGKTFYEALTCRLPWTVDNYQPVAVYNGGASHQIDAIILKCIEGDRERRFGSVAELQHTIATI